MSYLLACLLITLAPPSNAGVRPQLNVVNGSWQPVAVQWMPKGRDPVQVDTIPPLGSRRIRTHLGQKFLLVGEYDLREIPVVSVALHQAVRFDPPDPDGVPSLYTQRLDAGGFPIVASAKVNPYALEEARYLVNKMLGDQNELRQAIIDSGARLCILASNEYTTDLPEWSWLARLERDDFDGVSAKDYYDRRARGMGGSLTDPFCSCGEENLLGYKGDPYSTENILVHEFAHCVHLRGMSNLDPTFDGRVKEAYQHAMRQGLWSGKYAAVNHHEYFAEGVQSWFNTNRQNDHDHNHVDTRKELKSYDPGLASLIEEVFGDGAFRYTNPLTRLTGHLEGYQPSQSPRFAWPKRLAPAILSIRAQTQDRIDLAASSARMGD